MLETMQNFESVMGPAARDYPLYVIAPGSAAVVAGLFIWLGGLGFKRVLTAIAGAAGGFAVGYFAVGRGVVVAAVLAGVAAIVAALLDRVFIALLAAILVAGVGFSQKDKMVVVPVSCITADAASRREVYLTANDGLYPHLSGSTVELNNAIHGAVVGDCQAVHTEFFGS